MTPHEWLVDDPPQRAPQQTPPGPPHQENRDDGPAKIAGEELKNIKAFLRSLNEDFHITPLALSLPAPAIEQSNVRDQDIHLLDIPTRAPTNHPQVTRSLPPGNAAHTAAAAAAAAVTTHPAAHEATLLKHPTPRAQDDDILATAFQSTLARFPRRTWSPNHASHIALASTIQRLSRRLAAESDHHRPVSRFHVFMARQRLRRARETEETMRQYRAQLDDCEQAAHAQLAAQKRRLECLWIDHARRRRSVRERFELVEIVREQEEIQVILDEVLPEQHEEKLQRRRAELGAQERVEQQQLEAYLLALQDLPVDVWAGFLADAQANHRYTHRSSLVNAASSHSDPVSEASNGEVDELSQALANVECDFNEAPLDERNSERRTYQEAILQDWCFELVMDRVADSRPQAS